MALSQSRALSNAVVALPVVLTLVFIGWTRLSGSDEEPQPHLALAEGDRLPDVMLTDADGRRVPLSASIGTGPWLILLVSETCPHCETQVAAIEEMAALPEGLGGLDVSVVVMGEKAREPLWRPESSSFPVYEDRDGELKDELRLRVVPVSLFGRGDATVRRVEIGWTSADRIRGVTAAFLSNNAVGAE